MCTRACVYVRMCVCVYVSGFEDDEENDSLDKLEVRKATLRCHQLDPCGLVDGLGWAAKVAIIKQLGGLRSRLNPPSASGLIWESCCLQKKSLGVFEDRLNDMLVPGIDLFLFTFLF